MKQLCNCKVENFAFPYEANEIRAATPFLPPFCSRPIFCASRIRKTNTRFPNFVRFVRERLLRRLSWTQQCCDMLRWFVAIVWPGLYNIKLLFRLLSKLDKHTLAANRHSTTLALKCVPAVADFFISTYI